MHKIWRVSSFPNTGKVRLLSVLELNSFNNDIGVVVVEDGPRNMERMAERQSWTVWYKRISVAGSTSVSTCGK